MKSVRFFLTILFLSILIGACCHSPNPVCHHNHHMPYGFEYVGYNPGYVYPSLSDFSDTLHDVDYAKAWHHECAPYELAGP